MLPAQASMQFLQVPNQRSPVPRHLTNGKQPPSTSTAAGSNVQPGGQGLLTLNLPHQITTDLKNLSPTPEQVRIVDDQGYGVVGRV